LKAKISEGACFAVKEEVFEVEIKSIMLVNST